MINQSMSLFESIGNGLMSLSIGGVIGLVFVIGLVSGIIVIILKAIFGVKYD